MSFTDRRQRNAVMVTDQRGEGHAVTTQLPVTAHDRLLAACKALDLSKSAVLRRALTEWLETRND